MKKYLMSLAAIALVGSAFVSCSNDDMANPSQADVDQAKYEAAFLAYVGGKIAPNQDWGFSTTRSGLTRGNAGETYPATHEYSDGGANCNANEWADPAKEFGGWLVPDPLTEGQKLRVQRYFQTHPNLGNRDPHLRHFFVQQVYKGGDATQGVSSENIIAADGSVYTSDNMNHLTVGQANMHINNFNGGDATELDVLKNGQSVGGTTQKDKIMLMVNVDDTSCFGYHDTGSSNQSADSPNHNDKWALVSAAEIDLWGDAEGIGEKVTDKWNRSFMGFDLAIKEGAQAYATDASGNVIYATYDQAAESPQFAWDGENIIPITTGEYETIMVSNGYAEWEAQVPVYLDEYKTIMNRGWLTTNENFYVAADKVSMSQTISLNSQQVSTIVGNIKNAPVLKDVKVGDTYYQSVINLPRIKQLVDAGYLPVKDKSLSEWVKVGKSDGYFTDWIVTLCEAKRVVVEEEYDLRIIAEDLSASQASDFDFNDIVIDIKYGTPAKLRLMAAGGTLPLRINEDDDLEVHKLFGEWLPGYQLGMGDKTEQNPTPTLLPMINTGAGPEKDPVVLTTAQFSGTILSPEAANGLKIEVYKNGSWQEMTATKGKAACKLAVKPSFHWQKEYTSIKASYPLFLEWCAEGPDVVWY